MPTPLTFAAVGDVHGEHRAMVRLVSGLARARGVEPAAVLQVGDFEPHRHEDDLASMAAPQKYRHVGDFPRFVRGEEAYPWPLYFIGGNHEPYAFLDETPDGAALIPGCHYLGRVGVTELEGLRVVGVSGIHHPERSRGPRPPGSTFRTVSNKEFTYFTEDELERALALGPADVLMLHEWPAGLVTLDELSAATGRRFFGEDVGNTPAQALVELLRPKLLLLGHMHVPLRRTLRWPDGGETQVIALSHVGAGRESVALIVRDEDGTLRELR
ncbi:metallophosphoesterase [Myxococcota bacterium]|nr:metallophosphoesterase [Myxococcota bacterium]